MSSEVALTGVLPALLIAAAVLALPLTLLLLGRYRRQVVRAIRRKNDQAASRFIRCRAAFLVERPLADASTARVVQVMHAP